MRGPAPPLVLALAAASMLPSATAAEEPARSVAVGKQVSIRYTLRLEDGTVVESNFGEADPFVYRHGGSDLLPGLERALEGMAVGESKRGTLAAADAFGEIDPAAFVEVEAARIPEQDRRAGAWLDYRDEHGERQRVRVHEVRGDRIVVDMNPPYAGSNVRYEVEVVKIE